MTAIQTSEFAAPASADRARSVALWPMASLFVASLCIRLVVGSYLGFHAKLQSDEPEYFNAAASLARGDGYRLIPQQSADGLPRLTAYRMPGPALMMALAFRISSVSIPAARLASAVFGAFAAPLMYLFARRFTSPAAATLAGIAVCLHPVWNFTASAVASEPYFVPLLLLSLLLTAHAWRRGGWLALAAGVAWGISTLMRPHAFSMAGLVLLLAITARRLRFAALIAGGLLIMLFPWTVRNYLQFHRFEPLATESGETLLGANNPYVLSDPSLHGMWIAPVGVPQYRQRLADVHDDFQRSAIQRAIALQFLNDNRAAIPRLVVFKIWRWLTPFAKSRGAVHWIILGSYGLLLAMLAIGLPLRLYSPTIELKLTVLCTISLFITTAVYWGNLTSGRMPLEIIWIPWASAAACRLFALSQK